MREPLPVVRLARLGRSPTENTSLWLASALARRDGASEAAADRALALVIAERATDQLAPPQRGERGVVRARVEKVGEARRSVDEQLHAHERVVAAGRMRA